MRKKSILMAALMVAVVSLMSCTSAPQGEEFVIEGRLTDVPDSTIIAIGENMGNSSIGIATDTIINGKFRLVGKTNKEGLRCARIYCHTLQNEFTCMTYDILYLLPGAKVTINGKTTDYSEWQIESNVPAQKTINLYRKQAQAEYSLLHHLSIEHFPVQEAFFDEKTRELPVEEQLRLKARLEEIRSRQDSVDNIFCRKNLNLMAKLPVDEVWLQQMRHITWCKDQQVQKVAKQLCQRMEESHKETHNGQFIMNHFFPDRQVNVGDGVPDIVLKDTLGNTHRLQELRGKYLLLDFWRDICQPCVMSIPEMGQIAEQMADSVTVVSISLDPLDTWKEATVKHGIKWHSWNDLKQENGIFARFGVKAYPTYFLVSPDGKLIGKQVGYSNGILFKFVKETIEKHKKQK